MSTTSIRDWIEYDGKNYIIDDTNNVYELTLVTGPLAKDILDAIIDESVEITDTSSNNSTSPAITVDRITDTPINTVSKSGKRWSTEDVETLKQLFTNGNTISQISEVLDRTSGGIFSKLQHLDLINKMERLDSYEKREQKKPAIPLPNFTKIEKKPVEPIPTEPKKKTLAPLTSKQLEAFELFLSGKSFCLTGPGGTGKSYIIKHIVENCKTSNISCAITAMTGVAASLISGQTLHKWSGLGLMDRRIETMVGIIRNNEQVLDRWTSTKVLVIDEVSMMNQEMFELLHVVFCKIRGNKEFYGGIQVIFCCDFAQLAPINGNYAFESPLWQKELSGNTIYLNQILRQDNPEFIKMLGEIRLGIVSETSRTSLNSRLDKKAEGPIQPTILYPHRKTVEETNNRKLDELKYEKRLFTAKDTKYEFSSKTTKNATAKDTETLEERSPKKITLCEQAQVMLSVNIDTEKGLVNGSRGIITGFTGGNPDVLFDNGKRLTITPNTFECQTQTCIIRRVQIPLVLAWATTIHKCQGSTLTHAVTDLRDAFCNAQGYVTLSRLKSLDGLYLMGIDYSKIKCDSRVKVYYDTLSKNTPYPNTKNAVHILENYLDNVNSECYLCDSD
jgi:ATP-dependent DNA helicase PIF1